MILDRFGEAVTNKLLDLERENAVLKARVDTLTAILTGDKSKSADVIDLPDWRRRDVA